MESRQSRRLAATLAHRSGTVAGAPGVAVALISVLRDLDAVLGPIIGRGGVAALCRRSLHLAGRSYPWLAGSGAGVLTALDLAEIESVFAAQSTADAAAAGEDFLQTLYDLLITLIGPSLADRLLRSVWADS